MRLLFAEVRIHAHHHRAERGKREEQDGRGRVVVRHDRDPIARLHPVGCEQYHRLVHARAGFGVRQPRLFELDKAVLRNALCAARERAVQRVIVRRIAPQNLERCHSTLAPDCLTMLAMRAVSLRISSANCSGLMAIGSMPWLVMFFSTNSRSASTPATVALSFAMISLGVAAGARKAYQAPMSMSL